MAVMNAGTGAKGRGSVEEGRISAEVVGGGGWLCGEAATERGGFFFLQTMITIKPATQAQA